MSKVVNIQRNKNNVILLPNVFNKLLNLYINHQNDIRKRKIVFLINEAYQYFYDSLIQEIKTSGVDLPIFVLKEQIERRRKRLAEELSSQVVLQVIADGRVNECFSRRVNELRKKGIKVSY